MCLYPIEKDRKKMIRTASEDMIVYKVVKHVKYKPKLIKSYYRNHTYVLGEKQPTIKFRSDDIRIGEINYGYHSYKNLKSASTDHVLLKTLWGDTCEIVECTIPKGETCIMGIYDEVVSTSIIINKVINNEL